MDVFDSKKRSEIMSRIRSKNTKAEKIVFAYLRKSRIYFQKHYSRVVGKPDIALPRKKIAVFIDGDFWHGRHYERILNSRGAKDYWPEKIKNNVNRDAKNRKLLNSLGWKILSIWESDIVRVKTRGSMLQKISDFLNTSTSKN